MISSNAAEVAASLDKYAQEIERKLEGMVKGYISEFADAAVHSTPMGDSRTYASWYETRYRETGLYPMEGIAQGAWTVTTTSSVPFLENYGVNSGGAAIGQVNAGLATFKLGQKITLGNAAPYIGALEQGYSDQAPSGITPLIMAAFKPDLKRYFDSA